MTNFKRWVNYRGEHPHGDFYRLAVAIVECACGANTVARTPRAETLADWTLVDPWPKDLERLPHVRAVCPDCRKQTQKSARRRR